MPFGFGSRSSPAEPPRASAFKPTFFIPYRPPRTSLEAQTLYNHVRTVAIALDSLSRALPLPFLHTLPPALDIGLEAVIGAVFPVVGDVVGAVLGLYIVFCCFLFGGVSMYLLGQMLLNVLIDAVVGIVPFIGDALDVAFKSNMRNLRLLEGHLERAQKKGGFAVDIAPPYEQEHPSAERPRPAPGGASGAGAGFDWRTAASLLNAFSFGGGAGSRR